MYYYKYYDKLNNEDSLPPKKINAPTVIGVIVIAVIDGREISRKQSRRFS